MISTLTIPDNSREAIGGKDDPRCRLRATLAVTCGEPTNNRIWMHVEAWAVRWCDAERSVRYLDGPGDSLLERLMDAADGPTQTVAIAGREYILLMAPFR